MRPNTIDIDVADANLTGFASNVTGGTWTISTTATTDGLAHQVSIRNDSATDHSAKTAILTGTDENGAAQTETVNLPTTSATIESTKYFKTLTTVVPSASIGADTMDIGWVDEVASNWYPVNWRAENPVAISVDVTGTIDFTVQETFVDILGGVAPSWVSISALAAKTADTNSTGTAGATAIRLIVNSYSSAAELQMYTSQTD